MTPKRLFLCVYNFWMLGYLFSLQISSISTESPNDPSIELNRFPSHPMLYFSGREMSEMRTKASSSHLKIAQLILSAGKSLTDAPQTYLPPESFEKFSSRWNEIYGNNLCVFSMYCVLYPDDEKAFGLLKIFMDRMASYLDWYVKESRGIDEVPVGHSLTGFATAYDFLYLRLEPERRKTYLSKIKTETVGLYEVLRKGHMGWTKQYIHNHAASNIVAIMLGGLVISVEDPDSAKPILEESNTHLSVALKLLALVQDGSIDEGVSYGSYTSRGLMQYVFLAARHFNIDHLKNPWLQEHFWFYFETVLPGFQRSVGIADANHNWFYGPESQLVFLDSYVLKNGYGNWLADKIRRAKPKNKPLAPPTPQRWSTLHTEFIFYNSSLKMREPVRRGKGALHIFHDWGTVTYGGSQNMKMGRTFLSFKSGAINGEAVGEILEKGYYPEWVQGWTNFNPGHEHPDHNSFIFAPNGRYFITEALYGPKYSYLDNVLLFSPSDTSMCNQPWEGQIGECFKWLKYKSWTNDRGEILSASQSDNMVFIAGQSVKAYQESLGLASVYRGLLLLNTEVLVVVDSIELLPDSKTNVASAIFHNMLHEFEVYNHLGYNGAQVTYPEGKYKMFSMMQNSDAMATNLVKHAQPGLREGPTNYINVTFNLNKYITNIVHIFTGPLYNIQSATFLSSTGPYGIRLSLVINGLEHKVGVATIQRSTSRKIDPFRERNRICEFGGYACVEVGTRVYRFGSLRSDRRASYFTKAYIKTPLNSVSDGTSFLQDEIPSLLNIYRDLNSRSPLQSTTSIPSFYQTSVKFSKQVNLVNSLYPFVAVVLLILVMSMEKGALRWKFKSLGKRLTAGMILLALIILANLICIDFDGRNKCWLNTPSEDGQQLEKTSAFEGFTTPFVFITSLPQSGSLLLENIFDNSSEFLYLSTSHDEIFIPGENIDYTQPDLCSWTEIHNEFNLLSLGSFSSLSTRPFLHFNNLGNTDYINRMKRHIRENRNSAIAFSDCTGFWNAKIPWVRKVVGEDKLNPIFFVRDPRSWIHALLSNDKENSEIIESLVKTFDDSENSCTAFGTKQLHLSAIQNLKSKLKQEATQAQKLAAIWTLSVASALYSSSTPGPQRPLQIVKFEDLLTSPEHTAKNIFSQLEMPLSVKRLSKLIRTVKSEFYRLPGEGLITPKLVDSWKNGLEEGDVRDIEDIACPVMQVLDYQCSIE